LFHLLKGYITMGIWGKRVNCWPRGSREGMETVELYKGRGGIPEKVTAIFRFTSQRQKNKKSEE